MLGISTVSRTHPPLSRMAAIYELPIIYLLSILLLHLNGLLARTAETKLFTDLLTNYDNKFMPDVPVGVKLDVSLFLYPLKIVDVDEKNQILTTYHWITTTWTDNDLAWNPEDYGGILRLPVSENQVWYPEIALLNDVDLGFTLSGFSTTNVVMRYSGTVERHYLVSYKSSCQITVRYFPFDTQNCSMVFFSLKDTEHNPDINMTFQGQGYDTSSMNNGSEFDLVGIYTTNHHLTMILDIAFRRRPLFYVVNMMLPCFVITMVAMLAFYVPSDSGEKLSLGITVLLSMTVFLLLISDQMPTSSADQFPLVAIYYSTAITLVSLSTAMSTVTLNLHHKGSRGKPLPSWVKKIFFNRLARFLCVDISLSHYGRPNSVHPDDAYLDRKKHRQLSLVSAAGQNETNTNNHSASQPMLIALQTLVKMVESYEEKNNRKECEEATSEEWRQLAFIVDKLLLLLFITITVVVVTVFMLYLSLRPGAV